LWAESHSGGTKRRGRNLASGRNAGERVGTGGGPQVSAFNKATRWKCYDDILVKKKKK